MVSPDAFAEIEAAAHALDAGRPSGALMHARRAGVLAPDSVDAAFLQALAAHQIGLDPDSGYGRVLALAPDHVPAAINLAGRLAGQGLFAAAAPRLRRIVALEPAIPPALGNLALTLRGLDPPAETARRLRRVLALVPDDAFTLTHLIDIAHQLLETGELAVAAEIYELALRLDPKNQNAARGQNLVRIKLGPAAAAVSKRWGTGPRDRLHPLDAARKGRAILLIRGIGVGFWGEVAHVANHLALAELTGRTPIVHWGLESRYRNSPDGNAWLTFFEPVSPGSLAGLGSDGQSLFPGQWTSDRLDFTNHRPHLGPGIGHPEGVSGLAAINRPEGIVIADGYADMRSILAWAAPSHPMAAMPPLRIYRELFARYIRPQPELAAQIATLKADLLSGSPTFAIHYRSQHSYKDVESIERRSLTLNEYFQTLDRWIAEEPKARFFLLTDRTDAVEAFRGRYGDRVFTRDVIRLTPKQLIEVGLDHGNDGVRLGVEVMLDTYLAAACDRFIGDGASGVSCSIMHMKGWSDDRAVLLRRNVFTDRMDM